MHSRGWRPFWAALGAALLLLLPLVGGTILLTRQALRQRIQTAEPQSGISVRLPRAEHRLTALVCTVGDAPGFVLVYLNASQSCVHLLTLPAELCVPFGGTDTTLAACYAAAGPARCREALAEALFLPEDAHYLALSAPVLQAIADRYGMLRVSFSGALTAQELADAQLEGGVQALSGREAQQLLARLANDTPTTPGHLAAARAAVWDAFFRQELELLPTTLPQGLRQYSSTLLTDLTAPQLLVLEETLEFLADGQAAVRAAALPGSWDAGRGLYLPTEASRAAMQAFFNLSPTDAQAASEREP